jgi:hypothetical protein
MTAMTFKVIPTSSATLQIPTWQLSNIPTSLAKTNLRFPFFMFYLQKIIA